MNHGDGALAFWTGFFSGGSAGTLMLKVDWMAFGVDVGGKILIAVLIAFLGGVAGLAGKDFYEHRIKKYIKK